MRFVFASASERQQMVEFLTRVRNRAASSGKREAGDHRTSSPPSSPEPPVPSLEESTLSAEEPRVPSKEAAQASASEANAIPPIVQNLDASVRLRPQHGHSGQSLIEFALIMPLLLLLIVNVVNFGGMLYAWIAVSNAARTGAQYLATGPAVVGSPVIPLDTAVRTLVIADMAGLRNVATAQVCISRSTSVTVSCNSGSAPSSAPPAAETAEGSPSIVYTVGAVDVTYTYTPMIPLWSFSAINIRATLPPTTIHRQAVMRLLQ